jgi:hypothetical protein
VRRLGSERYGAVSNDGGTFVSPEVGRIDPEHVAGVHVTQIFSFPSGDPAELEGMSEGTSSMRFYYEDAHAEHPTEPTTVPIGLANFADDFKSFRRFSERDHQNIVTGTSTIAAATTPPIRYQMC